MNKLVVAVGALLALAGCSRRQPVPPVREQPSPTARQPTLDPKSSAAAEELAGAFARLLTTGQADGAYMLLGPQPPSRKNFEAHFARMRDLRVTTGHAGDQEGAAGSSYVSVPLTATGTINGERVSRSAKIVLRRVNDVPGSTEAQRHWHIERVDWER